MKGRGVRYLIHGETSQEGVRFTRFFGEEEKRNSYFEEIKNAHFTERQNVDVSTQNN